MFAWTEAVTKAQSLDGNAQCKAPYTDHAEGFKQAQCWGEVTVTQSGLCCARGEGEEGKSSISKLLPRALRALPLVLRAPEILSLFWKGWRTGHSRNSEERAGLHWDR